MTRPQAEILVHIAAPSKASDDAKYRVLAQAYADFEPAGRIDIVSTPPRGGSSYGEHRQPGGSIPPASARSLQFLSLSFESVWDNVRSPEIGLPPKVATNTPDRPPRRRHQYVSPHDYIPDSQPGDDVRVGRHTILGESLELSLHNNDDTRITESQESGAGAEGDNDDLPDITIREAASPDLSVLPTKQSGSSFVQMQNQPRPCLSRLPLSQRSANSQQSSQQDGDGQLKGSVPPYGWEVVPSSSVAPRLNDDDRHFEYGVHIPSSLPDEIGKVVILVEDSSCELEGSFSSEPPPAPKQLRSDSERPRTKRHWPSRRVANEEISSSADVSWAMVGRRASDAASPQRKRRKVAIDSIVADEPAGVRGEGHEAVAREAEAERVLPENAETTPNINGIGRLESAAMQFPSSSPTASAPGLYHDNTLHIISPEPPVSCEHLNAASLVTEKMAKLARDLNMERRYRPSPDSLEGRVVQPFERGFWRLNTSGWPSDLRHRAWAFLAKYVGRGDAGWGVWCSRDAAPHTWLRLHCFAATVGHTYLLLYLASQRQILTTGAVWLDGSGTPTITMPPRQKKQQQ